MVGVQNHKRIFWLVLLQENLIQNLAKLMFSLCQLGNAISHQLWGPGEFLVLRIREEIIEDIYLNSTSLQKKIFIKFISKNYDPDASLISGIG